MDNANGSKIFVSKKIKSLQFFSIAATILLSLVITVICIGILMRYEVDTDVFKIDTASYWKDSLPPAQHVWYEEGIDELEYAVNLNKNTNAAKNVIIFMIGGITPAALSAARFAKEKGKVEMLSWDSFPHVAHFKNGCSDADICDQFTEATALLGGVKTTFRVGGFDATVEYRNCSATKDSIHKVKSIFEQANEIGLRSGFVTTQRITGPIGASLYAHTPDTSWECDAVLPKGVAAADCTDIAQQLLTTDMNVVLGGGRQTLVSKVPSNARDPIDERVCASKDGRHLIRDWQMQKLAQRARAVTVHNAQELRKLNASAVDYVLGVFANGALSNSKQQIDSKSEFIPTLEEMYSKAMRVLHRRKTGYILLVENEVKSGSSIEDQLKVLNQLDRIITNVTLGSNVRAEEEEEDTLTLLVFSRGNYATYIPDSSAETETITNFHDIPENDDNLMDERFVNIRTDTVVYAQGPQSHLFHGIHEDIYMSHVISHALRMGPYRKSEI